LKQPRLRLWKLNFDACSDGTFGLSVKDVRQGGEL
jgi:hypothetical protein